MPQREKEREKVKTTMTHLILSWQSKEIYKNMPLVEFVSSLETQGKIVESGRRQNRWVYIVLTCSCPNYLLAWVYEDKFVREASKFVPALPTLQKNTNLGYIFYCLSCSYRLQLQNKILLKMKAIHCFSKAWLWVTITTYHCNIY